MLTRNLSQCLQFSHIRKESKERGESAGQLIDQTMQWLIKADPKREPSRYIEEKLLVEFRHVKEVAGRDKEGVVWRLIGLVLDLIQLFPTEHVIAEINDYKSTRSKLESIKASEILDDLKAVTDLNARVALVPYLETSHDNFKRICKTTPNSFGWKLASFWVSILTQLKALES